MNTLTFDQIERLWSVIQPSKTNGMRAKPQTQTEHSLHNHMNANAISETFRRVQAKGSLYPEEFLRLEETGMPLRRALAIVTPLAYDEILAALPLPLHQFLSAIRREEVQTWMKSVFSCNEAPCLRCGHINALHPCEHRWEQLFNQELTASSHDD